MTVYDFVKSQDTDFDTYDTDYDVCVTVCVPCDESESSDWYDKWYNFIIQHVKFVEQTSECECVADWSGFIENNIEVFRRAANDMWNPNYININDDEELIYAWIKEINLWLAGYVSEREYHKFMENYAKEVNV